MSLLYNYSRKGFALKLAILEIVEFEQLTSLANNFGLQRVKLNDDLKAFLIENGDIINTNIRCELFRLSDSKLTSIGSKFQDFDAVL